MHEPRTWLSSLVGRMKSPRQHRSRIRAAAFSEPSATEVNAVELVKPATRNCFDSEVDGEMENVNREDT